MRQHRPATATTLGVLRQQRHPREGFTAAGTRILLNIRMGLQMSSQIRTIRERSVAVITREWFFASVGAYVTLEKPRSREGLPTHGTLAGQCVRPDMHLQRAEGNVHFFAVLTAELFSRTFSSSAVELAVFRQPGESGVAFTTVRALVANPLAPLLGEVLRVHPRRRRCRRRIGTQRGLIYGGVRRWS